MWPNLLWQKVLEHFFISFSFLFVFISIFVFLFSLYVCIIYRLFHFFSDIRCIFGLFLIELIGCSSNCVWTSHFVEWIVYKGNLKTSSDTREETCNEQTDLLKHPLLPLHELQRSWFDYLRVCFWRQMCSYLSGFAVWRVLLPWGQTVSLGTLCSLWGLWWRDGLTWTFKTKKTQQHVRIKTSERKIQSWTL